MFEITTILPIITYTIRSYGWMDLLSIESEISSQRSIKRKFMFTLFFCFPLGLMLGSLQIDDKSESLYLLALSICTILHSIKFHFICTKWTIFSVLLKDLSAHTFQSHDMLMATEKTLRKFHYFSIFLMSATMFILIVIYAFPFVFKKSVAFKIWFPLDYEKNDSNFWIANVFIMYSVFICVLMIAFTLVVWYVMLNTSIKFRTLGHRLENLGWRHKQKIENEISKSFSEDFVECLECYTTLTRFDSR